MIVPALAETASENRAADDAKDSEASYRSSVPRPAPCVDQLSVK